MINKAFKKPTMNKITVGYYCQKNTKPYKKYQYFNKFGVNTCKE